MGFQNLGGLLLRGQTLEAQIKTADEKIQVSKLGINHTVKYIGIWNSLSLPGYYSPSPLFPTRAVLLNIEVDKWMGKLAKVVLSYGPPEQSGGGPSLPPPEINEAGSTIEVPIEQHPKWNDDSVFPTGDKSIDPLTKKFTGFNSRTRYEGITSFQVGSKTVISSVYFSSNPGGSPLGLITEPPGYSESGHWLRIGSEVNKTGEFWCRRNTYLYSTKEWDSNIYSSE